MKRKGKLISVLIIVLMVSRLPVFAVNASDIEIPEVSVEAPNDGSEYNTGSTESPEQEDDGEQNGDQESEDPALPTENPEEEDQDKQDGDQESEDPALPTENPEEEDQGEQDGDPETNDPAQPLENLEQKNPDEEDEDGFPLPDAQFGSMTGESNVSEALISVIMPTSLKFTLDPFGFNTIRSSQISDQDYFFINKSNVPVRVTMEVTAVLKDGVRLTNNPGELSQDDPKVKDKLLYFAILGADSLESQISDNADSSDVKGVYNAMSDTLIPFDANENKAVIEFILAPASESIPGESGFDTLVEDNGSIGVFQFYSMLNTYAEWAANDITVSAEYTITPLRKSTYESRINDGYYTFSGWGTQLKQVNGDE